MTKIELPCSVITDLLPLYQDGLCSPESRALVEAHLQNCKTCSALSKELPLQEAAPAAVPDEAEAFRRVQKKVRQGKLLKAMSILAAVLAVCFVILNAVWLPVKYIPYRKLRKGLQDSSADGKGTQYSTESGGYIFRVKMPGYLGFEGGFLSVEPAVGLAGENADTAAPTNADSQASCLFIWPQIGGETMIGAMIFEQESPSMTHFTQMYISKDLEYLDELNTWQGASPAELQHNKELYEAHLDEVRSLTDAAKAQWPQLFE